MASSNWPYHITSAMQKLERELTEKTNEVARLREEANTWHQHYRDEASKAQKWKKAFIDLEKEVVRLRDEIQKLKTQPHFHHESYCRKCQEAR